MSQQQHYAQSQQVKQRGNGLAITALVLGIVGVVLSFMPILNNLTATGAAVGLVLGFIGIWKSSSSVMSGIGTFLCGVAIGLTVYAQQQLSAELDDLKTDLENPPTITVPVAPGK